MARLVTDRLSPERLVEERYNTIESINKSLPYIAPNSAKEIQQIEFDQKVTNHHSMAVAETALYCVDQVRRDSRNLGASYETAVISNFAKLCTETVTIGSSCYDAFEFAITLSALLHDIGKDGHADVINVNGDISQTQREKIEGHPIESLLTVDLDQQIMQEYFPEIPFNLIKFLVFMHHYKYIDDDVTCFATGLPFPSPSPEKIQSVLRKESRSRDISHLSVLSGSVTRTHGNPREFAIDIVNLAQELGVFEDLDKITGGKFSTDKSFEDPRNRHLLLQSLVNLIHVSDLISRATYGVSHTEKETSAESIQHFMYNYRGKSVPYSLFTNGIIGNVIDRMNEAEANGKHAANAIHHKPERYTAKNASSALRRF
jgi:hypothetical protein